MHNPVPHSSLFGTPASLEALDEEIRKLPANDRSNAYLYTMLAFNLAYKLVEQEKATEAHNAQFSTL